MELLKLVCSLNVILTIVSINGQLKEEDGKSQNFPLIARKIAELEKQAQKVLASLQRKPKDQRFKVALNTVKSPFEDRSVIDDDGNGIELIDGKSLTHSHSTGIPSEDELTLTSPPPKLDRTLLSNTTIPSATYNNKHFLVVNDEVLVGNNLAQNSKEFILNGSISAEGTGHQSNYIVHPQHQSTHYGVPSFNSHTDHSSNNHGQEYVSHLRQAYDKRPHLKPIKESVVHRNHYDAYDQYDAIRTKDEDAYRQNHNTNHLYVLHQGNEESHHGGSHRHAYGQKHKSHSHAHRYGRDYNTFKPYHYNGHHIPQCAIKSQHHYHNLSFCLEDQHYPTETITWALQNSGDHVERLLSDVTYQSANNLIDGLTREDEEKMTYDHYYGGTHQQHHQLEKYKPPYSGYSYNHEYYKDGGYICPSNIFYARPKRAVNTYGEWKIIVNLDYDPYPLHQEHGHHEIGYSSHHHKKRIYTQTLRLEQCIYANAPCSFIDSHYYSRCVQKHNFVRLAAWTYEKGIHIDTFKLPIACSCHLRQPSHYYTTKPQTLHKQIRNVKGQAHNHVLNGIQGKTHILSSILG